MQNIVDLKGRKSVFCPYPMRSDAEILDRIDLRKMFGCFIDAVRRFPVRDGVQVGQVPFAWAVQRINIQRISIRVDRITEGKPFCAGMRRSANGIYDDLRQCIQYLVAHTDIHDRDRVFVIKHAREIPHFLFPVAVFLSVVEHSRKIDRSHRVFPERFRDLFHESLERFSQLFNLCQVDHGPGQHTRRVFILIFAVSGLGQIADHPSKLPSVAFREIQQFLQPFFDRRSLARNQFFRSDHPVCAVLHCPGRFHVCHQAGVDQQRFQLDPAVTKCLFQLIQIHNVIIKQFIGHQPCKRTTAMVPQHKGIFFRREILCTPTDIVCQCRRVRHAGQLTVLLQRKSCFLKQRYVAVKGKVLIFPALQHIVPDADVHQFKIPLFTSAGFHQDIDTVLYIL